MADFHDSILKGEQAKQLIKILLQKAGYSVYPFGYESALTDVKQKLRPKETKNSPTVRRIRSSPDLLVFDDERKDLMLVEVKMRNSEYPLVEERTMKMYKEFWNDAILVLVAPIEPVFFAQRICDLECKDRFNPSLDFLKIQEIFLRLKLEDIQHYSAEALRLMRKTGLPTNSN